MQKRHVKALSQYELFDTSNEISVNTITIQAYIGTMRMKSIITLYHAHNKSLNIIYTIVFGKNIGNDTGIMFISVKSGIQDSLTKVLRGSSLKRTESNRLMMLWPTLPNIILCT